MHETVTGAEIRLANLATLIVVYTVGSLIVSVSIDVFESYFILSHLHWTQVLPFMFITMDTFCFTAGWAFSCYYLGRVCDSVYNSLELACRNRRADSIDAHRQLWLELCQLYDDYCSSQEYRMLAMLLLMLVCLVISCYGVVNTLYASGDGHSILAAASFAVPLLYAICLLVVICECGHRASIKIGEDFFKKLDWIESSSFTPLQWHQMDTFMECIEIAQPAARVCGIFTINRKLFMQVIYEIASYLIILVQFQATEKKHNE
ncbi:gustatory and odorant receptor 24-like isoform X2 [Nilaparvata lugens]|uniref:gustatory and odorant receptor 24-like isoform X2 n=1 Tax=Nilaparvata lugens TaxID=108931 RepID=UPI00193E884C|nr:gustatory and odorant receptor 24-like isoform X2 [Nilaparvata lugens]